MKLLVYTEDTLAGELFTSDQGICFKYNQDYLSKGGFPLSLSLPLTTEVHPQSSAEPFFEGLLPEGEQRRELGRLLHVSTASTMNLLRALAGECIGNLILADEEMDIADLQYKSAYTPLSPEELEVLLRPQSIERMNFIVSKRLSLAGAQAKIGLYHEAGEWFATEGLAPTTHIIKPASLFDSSLLINEFFMMRLASNCGIQVPDTSIIRYGEHYGFVVERFDRRRIEGKVIRIGQEDFCQALSILPEAKYENDGGPGFKELFTTTLHQTAPPIQNILRLLRVVLFNYLTGNCDAHGKNFSLLQDPDSGYLSLTPAYDLVNTTYYGNRLFRSMAMRIGKHSRIDSITEADFSLFSVETGVALEAISTELQSLCESITGSVDKVVEAISQEAEEYLPEVKLLREHLLQELEQRVVS